MISALPRNEADTRDFFIPFCRHDQGDPRQQSFLSLRDVYTHFMLPELSHLTPNALCEDRNALRHWERYSGNPDIRSVEDDQRMYLAKLRDGMKAHNLSDATINKTWRELRAMFSFAKNELKIIRETPSIAYRMHSKLVVERPKIQRESLQDEELERLWRACSAATYPAKGPFPAPLLWRVAIVLFSLYGPRTEDVLTHLTWQSVKFRDRLIQFFAQKTRKLQGLPLSDLAIAHLRSIKGRTEELFGFYFRTPGGKLKATSDRPAKWVNGWRTTWRNEILPAAGFHDGDVNIKHFREMMATRYNEIDPGVSKWIAGHAEEGTTEKFYELPTKRVRRAIESAVWPKCFHDIG